MALRGVSLLFAVAAVAALPAQKQPAPGDPQRVIQVFDVRDLIAPRAAAETTRQAKILENPLPRNEQKTSGFAADKIRLEQLAELVRGFVRPRLEADEEVKTLGAGNLLALATPEKLAWIERFLTENRRNLHANVALEVQFIRVPAKAFRAHVLPLLAAGAKRRVEYTQVPPDKNDIVGAVARVGAAGELVTITLAKGAAALARGTELTLSSPEDGHKGKATVHEIGVGGSLCFTNVTLVAGKTLVVGDVAHRTPEYPVPANRYALLGDASARKTLLSALLREREVEILNAPRMMVAPLTRAQLLLGKKIAYVKDFELQVTKSAVIADPVVGTVVDGQQFGCSVAFVGQRAVGIRFRFVVSKVSHPIPEFTTTLANFKTPIKVQLPQVRRASLESRVELCSGQTGLFAAKTGDGEYAVVLLQARPIAQAGK